ncbi:MAG: MurR/RpiR family transcriptional regulator [Bacillus sp. (in: firmicutes)]
MDLQEKVKEIYASLSAGQKKVAKHLLDHPQKFAVHSASEIGKEVGVSETTIIRFCYSLQLKGYSELQKKVRNTLIFANSSLNEYYSSKKQVADQPHFFAEVMEQDISGIQRTIANLSAPDFAEAVSKLASGDYILISGHRLSFAAAHWLNFTLRLVRDEVHLYRQDTDDLILHLDKISEHSVFVAISFHRYVRETVKLAELAKQAGAFVIAITDSEVAPVVEFADITLPISRTTTSTIDAAPALFSLCNALVAGVSVQDDERFKKRKVTYDSFHMDDFFL